MTEGMGLDAPITGVTVFRDGARVQRSGTVSMAPGRQAVVVGGLPAAWIRRRSGSGRAGRG